LLNMLSMPMACTSSLSSMPMINRSGLLMELQSSYILHLYFFILLSMDYSVFSIISTLSSSPEMLSYTCFSLMEWLSIAVFI
jgi:hypothetical protein